MARDELTDPRQYVPEVTSSTANRDAEIASMTLVAVIVLSIAFGFILGRTY